MVRGEGLEAGRGWGVGVGVGKGGNVRRAGRGGVELRDGAWLGGSGKGPEAQLWGGVGGGD